jgi:hypothetical protein
MLIVFVTMDNIVQCLASLIFIRTVNIIQRRPDLIKPTSPVVLATPGDIIQRRRDLIKCKSPVKFCKACQHYAKATRRYKSWSFGKAGLYYTNSTRPCNTHNQVDNVQRKPDLIKCTCAVVSVRLVNILQRQSDLIKVHPSANFLPG